MNPNTATTVTGIATIVAETLAKSGVVPEVTNPLAVAFGSIFAILTNQPISKVPK
jgi:hypothetical protein